MRTVLALFTLIILILLASNTNDNSWTDKRQINALISEKWEDWSGEATHPYKVMFAVSVQDKNGGTPTTYYERGKLDAQEWNKVIPGVTTRTYTTSYKDLGVPGTKQQVKRDDQHDAVLFFLFIVWPVFAMCLLFHWMNEY